VKERQISGGGAREGGGARGKAIEREREREEACGSEC